MQRDLLPFSVDLSRTRGAGPDPSYVALPLLRQLAKWLEKAEPHRIALRQEKARARRWAMPPVFFFHKPGKTASSTEQTQPMDTLRSPAPRIPGADEHWRLIGILTKQLEESLAHSVDVRRTARAVPGLKKRLADFADDHPGCRLLSQMLAVTDDFVLTVLHPQNQQGWRLVFQGVRNLFDMNSLLVPLVRADSWNRLTDLPRLRDEWQETPVASPIQLYQAGAMESGELPRGIRNVDSWYWGHETVTSVSQVMGERVLLIGEAPYPRYWIDRNAVPVIRPEMRIDRVLTSEQMQTWQSRLGKPPGESRLSKAA